MLHAPIRRGLGIAVTAALLGPALATAAASPSYAASAAPAAPTKTVSYLGRTFTVPSAWPVVNLATAPTTCVAFNRNVVYLGTPGQHESCPADPMGLVTDGLLIEPASATASRAAVLDAASQQITSTAAGISVTARYSSSPTAIDAVLASAGLAQPSATERPAVTPNLVKPMTASLAASVSDYTGNAFDTSPAPSSGAMSAWRTSSPYDAVGIYIGGSDLDDAQPNLTAGWVSAQAAADWHFIPIWGGPEVKDSGQITSPASQGAAQAEAAVSSAESLGFGPGTPIYYDMEFYTPGGSTTTTALTFESAWTNELHALGFASGLYGSESSVIADLVNNYSNSSYTMPDVINFAAYPSSGDTTSDPSVPSGEWANHQRVHQYSGTVSQTYGGSTISIDQDAMDVDVASQMPVGGDLGDVVGNGLTDILATNSTGSLLLYANTGNPIPNPFSSGVSVGSGWVSGHAVVAVGDLWGTGSEGLLGTAPGGALNYYPNTGHGATYANPTQVGEGFTGYTVIGLTDLFGSGHLGLLAMAPNGNLLYFPNTGNTGSVTSSDPTFGASVEVGTGFSGYTVDVADMNGDGKPDLIAVAPNGNLEYFQNSGNTGGITSSDPVFTTDTVVGSGFNTMQAVDTGYLSGAKGADLVTINAAGQLLLYANDGGTGSPSSSDPMFTGTGVQIGTGWSGLSIN